MPQTAAPRAQGERDNEQPSFFRSALQSVAIFLLIQFVTKQVMTKFMGPQGQVATTNSTTSPQQTIVPVAQVSIPPFQERPSPEELADVPYNAEPQYISPMWNFSDPLDIAIYVSPSIFIPQGTKLAKSAQVLHEEGIVFGGPNDTKDIHATFKVPKEVQNNGTLFGHIFVARSGSPWDPSAAGYDAAKAFHIVRPLTQHLVKKKVVKTRNLLSGDAKTESQQGDAEVNVNAEESQEASKPKVKVAYYHPNFTLAVIPDSGVQSYTQLQPGVRQWIELERSGARDISGLHGWYYPTVFLNTFWQLRTHMQEVNSTVEELPINVHLTSMANWKFTLVSSLAHGMTQKIADAEAGKAMPGGGDGSEFEEIKRILLDSNPYLLATTIVVGLLHTVFEMLAFKNDVSHWRNKKDNVGVSVRTILGNVFMQTVIFLYLVDNTENTSWMILFGQGMGILIEAWKITKTVDVRVRPNPPGSFLPYTITFEDKHVLSETEQKTQEYDQIAFKYLYIVAVPLLLAYAVYSVLYVEHRSWYSFIIATLVGSVYAYGFLMMVPSLYINYRLKSVAHMPAKAMTYKFLNTFIDDLFAFTIKMPTLHRLATLRDDVIFFVYLYQSWKYKIDYSRVNEFGQGGDDEEPVPEKLAAQPVKAPAGGKTNTPASDEATRLDKGASEAIKTTGREDGEDTTKRRK